MKTVDYNVQTAIEAGRNFTVGGRSDTKVRWNSGVCEVWLYGNRIFHFDTKSGEWEANMCGWRTQTTRNRINACLHAMGTGAGLVRRNYKTCLTGPRGKTFPLTSSFIKGCGQRITFR